MNKNMPVWLGWMLCVVVIGGYAASDLPPLGDPRARPA